AEPTRDPGPTAAPTGGGESGGGGGEGGSTAPTATSTSERTGTPARPPLRPGGAASAPRGDVDTTVPGAPGADLSELPTGALDLPEVGSDGLAELPTVTPGDASGTTVATEAEERRGAVAPSALLLFLLLLLLLAAPLGPARRVRAGDGPYRGRRRKP
ncbi:hypothetical protein DEF23_18230, partial [Marinitenerispora sediminis]